jgi:hypothetical protein
MVQSRKRGDYNQQGRVTFNLQRDPHNLKINFPCVSEKHGLLFTLTRATPTLKENVFPDFHESEQGPDYADGLTEEPRDPEPP